MSHSSLPPVWALEPWSPAATYGVGSLVLDRGGIWTAATENRNSRPISGNADWSFGGSIAYNDIFLDPPTLAGGFFDSQFGARSITGVNQGTRTFTVDISPYGWQAGATLNVVSSTGNDGAYTVVSTTTTTVTVAEAIPSAVADGTVRGPGIILVPAPGAGLIAQLVAVLDISTSGDAWAQDIELDLTYGSPAGFVDILWGEGVLLQGRSALAADFAVKFPFSTIATSTGSNKTGTYATSNGVVANQPVVAWTEQDPSNGGAGFGSRALQIRAYYMIFPVTVTAATASYFTISALNQGTRTFTVSPDPTSAIASGNTVTVIGSTGNDGTYTVVSRTATTVVVSQAIPSATADGWIKRA